MDIKVFFIAFFLYNEINEGYMQEILSYSETEFIFKTWRVKSLTYIMWTLFGLGIFLTIEFLVIGLYFDPESMLMLVYFLPLGPILWVGAYIVKRNKNLYEIQAKPIKPLELYKRFETEGIKFPLLYLRTTSKNNEKIPMLLVIEEHHIVIKYLKEGYKDLISFDKRNVSFKFFEVYKKLDIVIKEKFLIQDASKKHHFYFFNTTQKKFIDYALLEGYQVHIQK